MQDVTPFTIVQILSTSGTHTDKTFKGALADISYGGLSFSMKISKKETARLLLGRTLNMKFTLSIGGSSQKLDKNGKVVGVKSYPLADHSIHVKFDKMLEKK